MMLQSLAELAAKSGLALGRLGDTERRVALRVAAAALPPDAVVTEREANVALKAALAGPVGFLATDHVELRRWLVDTGWWRRDGYGRAYWRTAAGDLDASLLAIEQAFAEIDLVAWVAERQAAVRARRAMRRDAWASRIPGVR